MNRLAKLAAPLLLWTIPGAVFALGLGEIHVKSRLNEPLDAEIELLYSDSSEPQSTEVALASAEDFRRVGLDRSAISVPLELEIAQDASGRYLIRVSSSQPVGDPFVDFLIEVNWPNGRLLREYVILLDPPVTAPAEVAALEEPAPGPAPQPAPAPTAPREPRPAFDDGGTYEVVRGDTLWEIARDRRPSSDITINQMMMVLYQTNPDAFFRDNINALKAGAVLRLPQLEDLEALPVATAISQVRTQNQAWETYRQTWAGRPPTVSEAGVSADYVRGTPRPDEDDSRLELVPPAAEAAAERDRSASSAAELASLRSELARSREDLISASQENVELESRVEELESLIGNLERAITLKDADLADLQNQIELVGESPAAPPVTEVADQAADEAADEAEALLERELAAAGEVSDETTLAMQDFEDPGAPGELQDQAEPAAGEVAAETPADESRAADTVAVTPPPPQPGLVDRLMGAMRNPLVLGGLGLALVLGVGGFVWSRRRGEVEAGESLVDRMMAGGGEALAEPEAEEEPVEEVEVDDAQLIAAIDEQPDNAQAHLALLRRYYAADEAEKFSAAAARMLDSIGGESHPAWMEVRAMGANLAPHHPLFGAAVGAESPAADEPDLELPTAEEAAETVLADSSEFGLDAPAPDQPAPDEDDLSLDFELDEEDLPRREEEAPAAVAAPGDDDLSLDFELDDADLPRPETETEDEELALVTGETALDLGDEGLVDDLSLELDEAAASDESLPDLELELEDLDLGGEVESPDEAPEIAEPDTEFELQAVTSAGDEADTELDLDLSIDTVEEPETEEQPVDPEQVRKEAATLAELESSDEDLGLDDLDLDDKSMFGDDDAVGTKLDLAKAYIDMGDPEGARGMLEEVLAEGNADQKEEAEDLLGRLTP